MRYWLRQLHLYTALLCALIVSLVGVTGSVYVFEPELSGWLQRDYYQPKHTSRQFSSDQQLVRFIEQKTQSRIESLQWPVRSRETYSFKLFEDEHWYFFDQSTGVISSDDGAYNHPALELVYRIHSNLLLGEPGRYITATASLLFALSGLITGLYLWWPKSVRRLKQALTVNRSNAKRLNFDLHASAGAWFSIPLLIMALTGAYFLYTAPMQKVIDVVTWSDSAPEDSWISQHTQPPMDGPFLSAEQVVSLMQQLNPGLQPRNLWMTQKPQGVLSLGYQQSVSIEAGAQYRVFLQLHPQSGQLLSSYDPATLPRASAFMAQWLLPLHFGEFGGWFSRILWCIGGLVPLLLSITGARIWLARNRLW
ncbi:PepSY domain-containing protein [Rheinheimera sediminis]|uniref:PepSY-associated TM helix domain-containing protein n=1 Tax=Rheinheimera sp. YQF-1 TaxID=2499626 RepID=UPI000FD79A47|nr:PepSY-associated TM helix domain-containing protein [Rheinheimera sp. YQF-1]RVT45020.1 PepSY domain-containing protein [Rheinheimera sp. YQF-1]